jgi:cytochrome P450
VAELSQDRPWLEQLRAELGDQPATFANLGDQPSLKDGLREATRLHGPNYLLSREARQDVVVPTPQGPLALEAGTQVLMPMRPLNSDPDNEDFNAGRDGSKIYSFGAGNRVCAGQVLARLEAQLIVSELVRRFELTPVNAGAPQPLSDFSSRPADMRYRLTSRVPSPGA